MSISVAIDNPRTPGRFQTREPIGKTKGIYDILESLDVLYTSFRMLPKGMSLISRRRCKLCFQKNERTRERCTTGMFVSRISEVY